MRQKWDFCCQAWVYRGYLWWAIIPTVQTVLDWKFVFCPLILRRITGKRNLEILRWWVIDSSFGWIEMELPYCLLIWMMHSRSINNKIKRIHQWVLRIIYKGKFSTFENLLEKYKAVKIHVRNMQVLVTEMFKVNNSIASKIINDIFNFSNLTYNLWNKKVFVLGHVKTVYFGTESLSYQGSKL